MEITQALQQTEKTERCGDVSFQLVPFENTPENAREILRAEYRIIIPAVLAGLVMVFVASFAEMPAWLGTVLIAFVGVVDMKEIPLCIMTRELCHQFFREHEADPAIFEDESQFRPYVYSEETADNFFKCKQVPGRLELVAMMDGRAIGHVQLKNIDHEKRECEFGFHMQNDSVKGLGYGTQIAQLALEYAFENLNVDAVYAYSLVKNTRSQHVLEKAGFQFIDEKDGFKYYRFVR